MSPLAGRVVWITGASGGIGEAVARELLGREARVALTARRADDLERIAAGSPAALVVPGDVTSLEDMRRAVTAIRTRFGAIDVALLNAGTYTPVTPDSFEPAVFRRHVEVNVMGTVNGIAAVLPHMRERRSGRIAVVSSVTAFAALPMASAYGASKAFQLSMAESLRADLEGEGSGVAVSVVLPGFVRTPLTAQNTFRMPFLIEPEDAARAIADGLERGDAEIAFPRQMALVMRGLRAMPAPLRRRYVAGIARRRARERGPG